jgi:hypothetical protein
MTAATAYAIDAVAVGTFRTVKYVVQISEGSTAYESAEILVVQNGTTAFLTTYANVFTGSSSLGTFSATIASGTMTLYFTPTATASYAVKVAKTQITV